MKFVHYYFGVMTVVSLILLVSMYCVSIAENQAWRKEIIRKYGTYMIIGIPFVVLFRLVDSDYLVRQYPWCVIDPNINSPVYLLTYFIWMCVGLAYSVTRVSFATYYVYWTTKDTFITWQLFSSIGFYVLGAILIWFPPIIINIAYNNIDDADTENYQLRYARSFPLYIGGILYTIVFVRDHEKLEKLEEYHQTSAPEAEGGDLEGDVAMNIQASDFMDLLNTHDDNASSSEKLSAPK
jgi:hypothetical protein